MQFTSLIFLTLIFPVFFVLAYITKEKPQGRLILCVISNVVFYIWGGYKAFLLSLAICLITWGLQHLVAKYPKSHWALISSVIIATPLFISKYLWDFFAVMGLSFYTFEAISLIVDTFKEEDHKQRSLLEIFHYMFFFPTVSQGPIIRIKCFEEGLHRNPAVADFNTGVRRFVIGLGKKVLVADKIAPLADYYFNGVSAGNNYSCFGLWMGSIAYTLQIYFDFSGYSDMAIGIAKLLGFNLPENFNAPYMATSIKDFWTRWHISLSTWFRDYLYIPLGGNRAGEIRTIINMLVVWLVTGIWHGNDLSFIVWGLGFFLLLIFEKFGGKVSALITRGKIGHIYTLFSINLLWVFFRSSSLFASVKYLEGLFNVGSGMKIEKIAIRYVPFIIVMSLLCMPWNKIKLLYVNNRIVKMAGDICLIAILILSVCAITNTTYAPFIYGKF